MPIYRRKYIDCFYYLNQEESNQVPYKIYSRGKRVSTVSLSECYDNPDPLMKIFKKRLNSSLDCGSPFNPIDYFGYQFFLVDDKNQELNFFHPNQNKQTPRNDFLLLSNLIKSQGIEVFKNNKQHKSKQIEWSSFQCEAFFEEDTNNLYIITRRLKSSNPEKKLLFNIAQNSPNDLSNLPTYLSNTIECKIRPDLIETKKEYPLQEIIEEAKSCLEDATIFSHYIYSQFMDMIKNKLIYHPQEVLSFYLTNPNIINIGRFELLQSIQKKYPFYKYPNLPEKTILTNLEWNIQTPQTQPTDENLFKIKINAHEKQFLIHELKQNNDIQKYIDTFNMHIDVFHIKNSEKIIPEVCIATKILEKIPCFHQKWNKDPILTAVNPEKFWAKSGGELRHTLYNPPYGTTGKDTIDLFDEDFIKLLFLGKPSSEWTVFSSSTDNEYFINEWWDYLWISFSRDGSYIVIISATATD